MLIHLPDAVALKYQQAADAARVPLPTFLERQLARFGDASPSQRVLVLGGEDLLTLDTILGLGTTASPQTLLTAIRAWAGITLGDIRLDFTPAQLAEIVYRADKQGKTPHAVVEDIVQQMSANFFHEAVVAR